MHIIFQSQYITKYNSCLILITIPPQLYCDWVCRCNVWLKFYTPNLLFAEAILITFLKTHLLFPLDSPFFRYTTICRFPLFQTLYTCFVCVTFCDRGYGIWVIFVFIEAYVLFLYVFTRFVQTVAHIPAYPPDVLWVDYLIDISWKGSTHRLQLWWFSVENP